jgi:hypothetical protein
VKGLIFNLLDSMARNSGCADEAWDLVMEFVASETEHDAETDTCLSCFDPAESLMAFETPAEAMIQCLGTDTTTHQESLSEFPDLAVSGETDETGGDPFAALVDADLSAAPAVLSPEGFSHDLLTLLEQLLAEALTDDEEDDDADDSNQLSADFIRRTSH